MIYVSFPMAYLTSITDASVKQRDKAGKIQRLLRHRTSPLCQAIPRKDMTGENVLPDGFFLKSTAESIFSRSG